MTDQPIAQVIHDEIKRIFANGVDVFASSVPGSVDPGEDWLERIRENLEVAHAVIVIVTPVSINRPWIWFEVGASWSRMLAGEGRILPICAPEVDKGSLPQPLSRLQAMSLGRAAETRLLFQSLIDHFGFGSLRGFRHATIKGKLPKYEDLAVAEADLRSGTIYAGPYEAYTDAELSEVMEDEIVQPDWDERHSTFASYKNNLFHRQLVHFRNLDEQYLLPPGTTKRLLPDLVERRFPGKIVQHTDNTIRVEALEGDEYDAWFNDE